MSRQTKTERKTEIKTTVEKTKRIVYSMSDLYTLLGLPNTNSTRIFVVGWNGDEIEIDSGGPLHAEIKTVEESTEENEE